MSPPTHKTADGPLITFRIAEYPDAPRGGADQIGSGHNLPIG